MLEYDIVKYVELLETDDFVEIIAESPNGDLSMPCIVSLKSSCLDYFTDKKITKNNKSQSVDKHIYIPTALSVIAIILSVISLIKQQ